MLKTLRSPHPRAVRERWWLLIAWLVLGAVLAGVLWMERRDTEAGERLRLQHQVGIIHDNVVRQLRAIDSVLQRLVRDTAAGPGDAEAQRREGRLQAFSAALAGVRTLNVLDARGRVLASSRPELVGQDAGDRDYFRAARAATSADTLIVGRPFMAPGSTSWYLTLGRVVPAADGSFGGTVMATLDPEQFLTLLESVRYAGDMRSGLVHGDGQRFLMASEQPGPPGAQVGGPDTLFTRHRSSGQDTSVLEGPMLPGGTPMLAALRTIAPPDLHMDKPLVAGVARDQDALLADWRASAWAVVAAYLAAGLAAAVVLLLAQWRRRDAREHARRQALLEARWRAVLEATSLGIWEWRSKDGLEVYFSPAWKALLGYEDADAGDQVPDWRVHLHPDERERVLGQLKRHLRGETPIYEVTHRMRRKDGSWRWVVARGRVLERDAHGRALRFAGAFGDAAGQGELQYHLDRLAASVPGGLYQYQREPDGRSFFPYASAGMEDIYGFTPEELRADATPVFARIHADDLQQVGRSVTESERTLQDWHAEYRVVLPGRGERWIAGQARPQHLASGGTLWHGYLQDVTQAKQQALQLQETERLLQHVMQEMPIGLAMVDESGRMYFRNRRFVEYFGYSDDELSTLAQWWQLVYPDAAYRAQVQDSWGQAMALAASGSGDIEVHEYRTRSKDGSERDMAIGGLLFGGHFLATFFDRTEQRAQSEMLRKLAYMDSLTGVANRRHFDQALDAEWRRCRRSSQPLALILIDIDHFKQFNDLYGHQAGDACLRSVAAVLRAGLGRSHDVVARYGGEEFVCLLPECPQEGASGKARALRQSVQELGIEHRGSSAAAVVTISAGVAALVPDGASSPQALLALADERLYRAKAGGRNRVDNGADGP